MTKNLKIALFTLLIFIGLLFLNFNSQSKFESANVPIFLGDSEKIFKFLIQNGNEAIELSRMDTLWKISGNDTLKVKSRSIDNLFDKVLTVNRSTILSENPEKYYKYSIDDSLGTHLAIIDANDKTMGYFIFGNSKSDYSRSYVRVADDPKVYLADQNVSYMLSSRETYWGEKITEDVHVPLPQVENSSDTTTIIK